MRLKDNSLIFLLKPSDGVVASDTVLQADAAGSDLSASNSVAGADQHDVEIHAKDACPWIIFQAQVDVLCDAEAEAARVGEVLLLQFKFLHFQTTIENFVGFVATNSHVNGNFLISSNAKCSHSVSSFGVDRLLVRQLLQNLGGTGQSVARLADAAIDDKLVNLQLAHGVLCLVFSHD